jgi:hypothetical protein
MFFTLALIHHLNQPPQIPVLGTQPVLIAKSYRSSSFRSSRSYSAPTRIRISNSPTRSVIRVSQPKPQQNINITKSKGSKPFTPISSAAKETTLKKLKGIDGTIPITKSVKQTPTVTPKPVKPVITRAPNSYRERYDSSPIIINSDSSFGNPWMWMYLLDRNNNQTPQTNQPTPITETSKPQVKTIVKEERNPVKDFLLIVLGVCCGVPFGYLIAKKAVQ